MERIPNSGDPYRGWPDYKPLLDEWHSYRVGMDTFKKKAEEDPDPETYTPEILQRNQKRLEEVQKRQTGEVSRESTLAEAVVATVPTNFGWLADKGVYSVVTEEHDDVVNHVDGVKEVVIDGKRKTVVRWAEDVTRRHPSNHNSASERIENKREEMENREEVRLKIKGIKDNIVEIGEGALVEYFESMAGWDISAKIMEPVSMPGVVISFPDSVIVELANLYLEAKDGNEQAAGELRDHPAREEYLTQVKIGIESQIREIEYRLYLADEKSRQHRWLTRALESAKTVLVYINDLIGESGYQLQNTWLEDIYTEIFNSKKVNTN